MDSLENIRKSLEECKGYRAQVGIFGDKSARVGKAKNGRYSTNADIGALMEFGFGISSGPFKGTNVAPRSFLRMPIATHKKEIAEMMGNIVPLLVKRVHGKIENIFARLGVAARKTVLQAFSTSGWGSWKENSPVTIILKGSDMPLIDTGSLRRSIVWRVKR